MRLRSLTLNRFGHFTDQNYDFGTRTERPDFHIIYGANEAGKTTTMEAALRLFYGFPTRDSYAFKHQRNTLQVSAQLDIDGQLRRFTRLPKRNGALLDEAGTTLPETALAAHLGGLSETDYRSLLCLDDETIERGGEEIAQAKGDIGRLLFSAAAGVSDLSSVLEAVRTKADALWRKRASKTRIAELKRALSDIDKAIREGDTSASAWRGLKKAAAEAQNAETDARQTRDALLAGIAANDAKHRALPIVSEIDALTAQITPFAAYPAHLDVDPETLVALVAQDSRAQAEQARLIGAIDAITAALDAIEIAPKALALSAELEALGDLPSRDRTAGLDIDRRKESEGNALAAMTRAAADLGVGPETDLQKLVLSPAEIGRLSSAREAVQIATAAAATAVHDVDALTDRVKAAAADHERAVAAAPDAQGIVDLLARYDLDHVLPSYARARQALQEAETAARDTLEALGLGAGIDVLPPCPTSALKAQDWVDRDIALRQKIDQADSSLVQHLEDAAARKNQALALTTTGGIVPDAEADALRHKRDALWLTHRQTKTDDSARAFEEAMQTLDAALALRVAQASDLGRLRQIEQAQAEAAARATQQQSHKDALCAQLFDLQSTVDRAADAVGLSTPILPKEWLSWVQRHEQAERAARSLERLRTTYQPVLDRASELLTALRPYLTVEDPELESAISAARRQAQAQIDTQHLVEKAQDSLTAVEADLKMSIRKKDEKQSLERDAIENWHAEVSDLLHDLIDPETLLISIDPLRDLREQDVTRAHVARQITALLADQAQFKTAVATLAKAHNIAQGEPPAATFAALQMQATAAQDAKAQADELTDSLKHARAALQEQHDILADIARQIEAIGRVFPAGTPVETLDALRQTVTRARQVIADRAERAKLERAVCTALGVDTMGAARTVLGETSAITLQAEGDILQTDMAAAEQALTRATETRVTAQQALAQVTGDAGIATLTERKATLELELEEVALEYLELALGHRVAEEAIRRYRDTHRSGMMTATERCFSTLTQGAYPRLITQPDGDSETLLAVNPQGVSKRAADMSKGTRFQLYLALRAAAHEQLVAQGTCLPFFCDDIFETFDEDRTGAACRVMEQIGRSGQAIYLTHHKHVVDIAQEVCDTPPIVHYV